MPDVTDRAAAADRKIIHDVNTHGWHVMKIMPKGDDPGWALRSVSFGPFRNPRSSFSGWNQKRCTRFSTPLATGCVGGTVLSDGSETAEVLERYRCMFRNVDRFWYRYVLGYATWFYGGSDFPVLQLLWPDKLQRYPWESAFETGLLKHQPLLFHADPREARAESLLGSVGGVT